MKCDSGNFPIVKMDKSMVVKGWVFYFRTWKDHNVVSGLDTHFLDVNYILFFQLFVFLLLSPTAAQNECVCALLSVCDLKSDESHSTIL